MRAATSEVLEVDAGPTGPIADGTMEPDRRPAARPTPGRAPATRPTAREAAPTVDAPSNGESGGDDNNPPGAAPARKSGRAKRVLLVGAALLALGGAARWGWDWWTVGRFIEETDNAYMKADIIAVAPQVAGEVAEVPVEDNQPVRRGALLVKIDDRTYRADLRRAEADVAAAIAGLTNLADRVALQRTKVVAAQADVRSAEAAFTFAKLDQERYAQLARTSSGSVQRAQDARAALDGAAAGVAGARARLASEERQLDVLASEHAQREADLARVEATRSLAEIDLARTEVRAPRDGTVGNKGVRLGEHVDVGQTLLSLVPLQDVYVVANFKETQLEAFRPGMPAEVGVDTLSGRHFTGRIESLAPASGAEFSVLPPDNATGNFTKIVQRIPVKIRLDVPANLVGVLRPGQSVVASVDTKHGPVQNTAAVEAAGH